MIRKLLTSLILINLLNAEYRIRAGFVTQENDVPNNPLHNKCLKADGKTFTLVQCTDPTASKFDIRLSEQKHNADALFWG